MPKSGPTRATSLYTYRPVNTCIDSTKISVTTIHPPAGVCPMCVAPGCEKKPRVYAKAIEGRTRNRPKRAVSLPQKPHKIRKISNVRINCPTRTCHVIQLYRDVTYAAMTRLKIDQ